MRKRTIHLTCIILIILIMITVCITSVYAYFSAEQRGYSQNIQVGTIVLSVNGNSDVRTINSVESQLSYPGDSYDFEIKVENLGVTVFAYDLNYSFVNEIVETYYLKNAVEVHYSYDNTSFEYLCMLNTITTTDYSSIFSGVLAPDQSITYYMQFRLSPGASDVYENKEFTLSIEVTSEMVVEDYYEGVYYVSSESGFAAVAEDLEHRNYEICLLSDITLSNDITFNSYTKINLNGKNINLNGHTITINDTSSTNSALLDSVSTGNIINQEETGEIIYNLTGAICLVEESLKNNALINLSNIDSDSLYNHLCTYLAEKEGYHYSNDFDLLDSIEIYFAQNFYTLGFDQDSLYSESNPTGYIIYDDKGGLSLFQHEYTETAQLNLSLMKNDLINGGIYSNSFSTYITIIGTGAPALAQEAIGKLPDVIDKSMFISTYDSLYNAYYKWYSSDEELFNSDGAYLKNGYLSLDSYLDQTITIGVRVEQNGIQSVLYEKEVTIVIMDAEERSELLYEKYESPIVLNSIGQEFLFELDNLNVDKTGFSSIVLNLDEESNLGEEGRYLDISENRITVLTKSTINSENIIKLTVTFTYSDGKTYDMVLDVVVIGYLQNVHVVDIKDEIESYLPSTDVYEDFILFNTSTQGVHVEFYSKSSYYSILTNSDGIQYVHFKVSAFPSVVTTISLGAKTYTAQDKSDAVEVTDLSFSITGIIHNNENGIPDEVLYRAILNACEGSSAYSSDTVIHGYKKDQWLTVYELSNPKITSLTVTGVEDITGVEFLSELTELSLRNGSIKDISKVSVLSKLKTLDVSNNQIVSISDLAYMDSLTTLNLSSNILADVSALTYLTNLTTLNLSNNAITSFEPLINLTNLSTLNINGQNYTGTVSAASYADLYYIYKLFDNLANQAKITYSTSATANTTITKSSTLSDDIKKYIVASRVLDYINAITTIQDTLNLVSTYLYDGSTYEIGYATNDSRILSINNTDYSYIFGDIFVDQRISILVRVRLLGEGNYTEMEKPITVTVKPKFNSNTLYIETEPGVYEVATDVVPDKILLNGLYNVFNVNTVSEIVIDGSTTTDQYVLTQEEINSANSQRSLYFSGYKITNLEGLQYFKSAIYLDLRYNIIQENFDKLGELTNLEVLYLNNAKYDFTSLGNLTNLTSLYVYGCLGLEEYDTLAALFDVLMNNYRNDVGIYIDSMSVSWNPLPEELDKLIQQIVDVYAFKSIGDTALITTDNKDEEGNNTYSFQLYNHTFSYSLTFASVTLSNNSYNTGDSKFGSFFQTSTSNNTRTVTLRKASSLDTVFYERVSIQLAKTGSVDNTGVYTTSHAKYITYKVEKNIDYRIKLDGDDKYYTFDEIFASRGLREYAMTCLQANSTSFVEEAVDGQTYLVTTEAKLKTIVVNTASNSNTSNNLNLLTFDGSTADGRSPMTGLKYTGITTVRYTRISKIEGSECENLITLVLRYSIVKLDELKNAQLEHLICEFSLYFDPWSYDASGNRLINTSALMGMSNLQKLYVYTTNTNGIVTDFSFLNYLPTTVTDIYVYGNVGSKYDSTQEYLKAHYNKCIAVNPTYTYDYKIESGKNFLVTEVQTDNVNVTLEEMFTALKGSIEDAGIVIENGVSVSNKEESYILYANSDQTLYSNSNLYLPTSYSLFTTSYTDEDDGLYAVTHNTNVYVSWTYGSINGTKLDIAYTTNGSQVYIIDLTQTVLSTIDGKQYIVPTISPLPFDIIIPLTCTLSATNSSFDSSNADTYVQFTYYIIVKGTANLETETQYGKELTYVNSSAITLNRVEANRQYTISNGTKVYSYSNFLDKELRNLIVSSSVSKNYMGVLSSTYLNSNVTLNYTGVSYNSSSVNYIARVDSLSGIEMLNNLTELVLPSNNVSDLTPLSKFATTLTRINLRNNCLRDISLLKGFTVLNYLEVYGNLIEVIGDDNGCYIPTTVTQLILACNTHLPASEIERLVNYTNLTSLYIHSTMDMYDISLYRFAQNLLTNMQAAGKTNSVKITLTSNQDRSSKYTVDEFLKRITYVVNTYDNSLYDPDKYVINRYDQMAESVNINYNLGYEQDPTSPVFSTDNSFTITYYDQNVTNNGVNINANLGQVYVLTRLTIYDKDISTSNFSINFYSKFNFSASATRATYYFVDSNGTTRTINDIFTDENFREYVLNALLTVDPNPSSQTFTYANLITAFSKRITISEYGIKDLTGIEYLPFTLLTITGNSFTALPELPSTLVSLTIGANFFLKDISSLYSLTNLNSLNLRNNINICYTDLATLDDGTQVENWRIIAHLIENKLRSVVIDNGCTPQLTSDYNPKSKVFDSFNYETNITIGDMTQFWVGGRVYNDGILGTGLSLDYEVPINYSNPLYYSYNTILAAYLLKYASTTSVNNQSNIVNNSTLVTAFFSQFDSLLNLTNLQTVRYENVYKLPAYFTFMGAKFNISYSYTIESGTTYNLTLGTDKYYELSISSSENISYINLTPRIDSIIYNYGQSDAYTYSVNRSLTTVTCTYATPETQIEYLLSDCYILVNGVATPITDVFADYQIPFELLNKSYNSNKSSSASGYYHDGISIPNSHLIDQNEINAITSFRLENVMSLKGIEALTNLQRLTTTGAYYTDFSPLSSLNINTIEYQYTTYYNTAYRYSELVDLNSLKGLEDTLTNLTLNSTLLGLNGIVDLGPLLAFTKLTRLTISNDYYTRSFDYASIKSYIALYNTTTFNWTNNEFTPYKSATGTIILNRYLNSLSIESNYLLSIGEGLTLNDYYNDYGTNYTIKIVSASKSVEVIYDETLHQYSITSTLDALNNDLIIIIDINGYYYQRIITVAS